MRLNLTGMALPALVRVDRRQVIDRAVKPDEVVGIARVPSPVPVLLVLMALGFAEQLSSTKEEVSTTLLLALHAAVCLDNARGVHLRVVGEIVVKETLLSRAVVNRQRV